MGTKTKFDYQNYEKWEIKRYFFLIWWIWQCQPNILTFYLVNSKNIIKISFGVLFWVNFSSNAVKYCIFRLQKKFPNIFQLIFINHFYRNNRRKGVQSPNDENLVSICQNRIAKFTKYHKWSRMGPIFWHYRSHVTEGLLRVWNWS